MVMNFMKNLYFVKGIFFREIEEKRSKIGIFKFGFLELIYTDWPIEATYDSNSGLLQRI